MTSQPLFQNTFILRRPRVAFFPDIIKILTVLLRQSLKTWKKLKELEIVYQNANVVKKLWCQQNSKCVSRDLYIFLDHL